jgi:hypothetical protein
MRAAWLAMLASTACGGTIAQSPDASDDDGEVESAPPTCDAATALFANEQTNIYQIATRPPYVYWIASTGDLSWLRRKRRDADVDAGCETLAPCVSFALDGDLAYCATYAPSQITSVTLDGSNIVTTLATTQQSFGRIFADGGWVYFGLGEPTMTIERVPETGGVPSVMSSLSLSPYDTIYIFGARDGSAYWWDDDIGTIDVTGGIFATSGDGVTTLLATPSGASNFVMNGDSIFFTVSNDSPNQTPPTLDVLRLPRSGGDATLFASGLYDDGPTALDDSALYGLSDALGLSAFPLDGGAPISTDADQTLQYLAVDDTYLYWGSQSELGAGYNATIYETCK